jgi:hypothetical protein
MEKRQAKGLSLVCSSCRARPARIIRSAYGVCRPHHGEFDDDNNPLDDNLNLYRPGKRLCGYRDCIEVTHIDSAEFIADLLTAGEKLAWYQAVMNIYYERKARH